jgi:hypothetical protein
MDSEPQGKRNCNARVRGQLSESDEGGGEADCRFVTQLGFVVPGIHGSEIFDFAEIIFDEMTPSIHDPIMRNSLFAIGF